MLIKMKKKTKNNMTRAWAKEKKSVSPTRIEPMASRTGIEPMTSFLYGRSWVRFQLGPQIFFFVPRSCHVDYFLLITLSPS